MTETTPKSPAQVSVSVHGLFAGDVQLVVDDRQPWRRLHLDGDRVLSIVLGDPLDGPLVAQADGARALGARLIEASHWLEERAALERDRDQRRRLLGMSPQENPAGTCQPGDPDPTVDVLDHASAICPSRYANGGLVMAFCDRERGHSGQHVDGDGRIVTAVWPQDGGAA